MRQQEPRQKAATISFVCVTQPVSDTVTRLHESDTQTMLQTGTLSLPLLGFLYHVLHN